jgi:DNA-binding CsgD family transcriptional regulator
MGGRSAGAVPPEAAGWLSLVMQTDGLALIIDLKDLTIVAASDAVGSLLADGRSEGLVGAAVYSFMARPPSGGLGMMARGVIDGYEAANALVQPVGEPRPVQGWMRAIGQQRPARYALMVLRVDDDAKPQALPDPAAPEAPIVLGVGDRNLTVTHITADVEKLCGLSADEVLGSQLLGLFTEDTVPSALWVLAQALQTRTGASGVASAAGAGGVPVPIDFLVCGSLRPNPDFGFALIPATDPLLRIPPDQQAMRSLARADRAAALYRRFPEMVIDPTLMSRLTFRELEIASLLLRGRRTPAIARALHLSPSTVRNHLSSIFAKAGVHSQQELLDVLGRKAS